MGGGGGRGGDGGWARKALSKAAKTEQAVRPFGGGLGFTVASQYKKIPQERKAVSIHGKFRRIQTVKQGISK